MITKTTIRQNLTAQLVACVITLRKVGFIDLQAIMMRLNPAEKMAKLPKTLWILLSSIFASIKQIIYPKISAGLRL